MRRKQSNLYVWPLDLKLHKLTLMQAMHAGVLRDMEQQRVKRERLADFEMQKQLEEEYRKIQNVHDSSKDAAT